jgi:hypothetical protein
VSAGTAVWAQRQIGPGSDDPNDRGGRPRPRRRKNVKESDPIQIRIQVSVALAEIDGSE